ncbi:methylenetetrahydrofolate reductase [Salaquimonas pukyongi]|uniref:methylenetetrahydrofolate reductase n=1 Tax=Salaquimonas pukyongi TaxID=2712698 RepID=UPI00096B7465|nr:methylenetetrahydrofolate reductase [Salaquimonas pukyongi]
MTSIPSSIEISPKQAVESEDLPGLFPAGTRVYITDVGTDPAETLTAGAKRVGELGYKAVPHFASRRLTTKAALENRIAMMTAEAGVTDVLVIGGGLEKPAGEFASTMEVLETGLFGKYGITHMGVAGHPEGSPDFSNDVAAEALRLKQAFAERSDIEMRIVTQFGFDAARFINWAMDVKASGVALPVHLGVAGPAKITTLLKFAAMCGVGNSLNFLKKRGNALMAMAAGFDPDEIVNPIEQHWQANGAESPIAQIHVFPFGGMKKSAEWLVSRGSWDIKTSLYHDAVTA